jgi:hypothetical protein
VTWVLILDSSWTTKPPAVIGGYATREEAERAGDLATAFEPYDPEIINGHSMPYWIRYVVVPGAAAFGPLGSTHCELQRGDWSGSRPGEITRITRRFP